MPVFEEPQFKMMSWETVLCGAGRNVFVQTHQDTPANQACSAGGSLSRFKRDERTEP